MRQSKRLIFAMKYTKLALTWEEQADLLISRGMQGDKNSIIQRLQSTNYYRLSGYWYPFREPDPQGGKKPADSFIAETNFETIWDRYLFDRKLRLHFLDAIERIEVGVKSHLMYHTSRSFGPFGYATNSLSFPFQKETDRQSSLAKIAQEIKRSKDQFALHFNKHYGEDHRHLPKDSVALPAWMLCEVISFGSMQNFYRHSSIKVKQDVSHFTKMPYKVFDSWLHALSVTRNLCAHHGRLWNKEFGIRPFIPKKGEYPDWHTPVQITNERIFGVLTICKYLLDQYDPSNEFVDQFCDLIADHPNIPLISMGFPENWKESPLWKLSIQQQPASSMPETSPTTPSP